MLDYGPIQPTVLADDRRSPNCEAVALVSVSTSSSNDQPTLNRSVSPIRCRWPQPSPYRAADRPRPSRRHRYRVRQRDRPAAQPASTVSNDWRACPHLRQRLKWRGFSSLTHMIVEGYPPPYPPIGDKLQCNDSLSEATSSRSSSNRLQPAPAAQSRVKCGIS